MWFPACFSWNFKKGQSGEILFSKRKVVFAIHGAHRRYRTRFEEIYVAGAAGNDASDQAHWLEHRMMGRRYSD